jgi:hypothetical protein
VIAHRLASTAGVPALAELRRVSRLAAGRGAHQKRTFVTLASPAPGRRV